MDFHKYSLQSSLDGEWYFSYCDVPPCRDLKTILDIESNGMNILTCTVPGNFELDLQANDIIGDPFVGMNIADLRKYENTHIWYFKKFHVDIPASCDAELVFEGLDCFTDIYLNGQIIGKSDNMLVEHVFNVNELLRDENEILIHIKPAVNEARKYEYPPELSAIGSNYESLYVRKAPHMYGWDIMPRAVSAGIWRSVKLRYKPLERIERVYLDTLNISPDHSYAILSFCYNTKLKMSFGDIYRIRVNGLSGSSSFETELPVLFDSGKTTIFINNPLLWWPAGRGDANLYDVTITLLKNGLEIDNLHLALGIRTIELIRTDITDQSGNGEFCFKVNGEKIFIKGSNWVPADAYHSRDIDRIPKMIPLAEEIGCNMFRCWGGNVYENNLFYDLCDKAGILIWQDFSMACAVYPQDVEFQKRMENEVRKVVQRLRQHACIALWAGDNECDQAYGWNGKKKDPNTNVITRKVIPGVLQEEDASRPYLPSSPYISPQAFKTGEHFASENHLWGPRDYYKSDFYKNSICHFASEMGYHGCPSPKSIARFISDDKIWPYTDNDEWILHSTSPIPGVNLFDYRVELMAKQVRELFKDIPDNLEDFSFASQVSQAEAFKFFIELFRSAKWRRTGILWWNLIDGWPQFSDAVVDYYFEKKLAYDYIKRSQMPLCVMIKEPESWSQDIVASNDTRRDIELEYSVIDADTKETIANGTGIAIADSVSGLLNIPYSISCRKFYIIKWVSELGTGINHYLAGNPPFDLADYRRWHEYLKRDSELQPEKTL